MSIGADVLCCPAGLPSSIEVKAIREKYDGKGLVYETATGKWRTVAYVDCTTNAAPLSRVKYQVRTSFSFKSHDLALRKRDAALMLLSNGRCAAQWLSGLPLISAMPAASHTVAVKKLMVEVLNYNAQEHVFLCKADFMQRPGALKAKGKPRSVTRHVAFHDSTEQAAQSSQPRAANTEQPA